MTTDVDVSVGRPESRARRWWADIAVRLAAAVVLVLIVGIGMAEGVAPGASVVVHFAVLPAVVVVLVVLWVIRAALRRRAGRPAPPWWRPGVMTAAVVAFVGYPYVVFPDAAVPLRANLALSRPALDRVVAEIERTRRVPDNLPTSDGDSPVRIGGFRVWGVGTSGTEVSFRISDDTLPDFDTYLVHCGQPDCPWGGGTERLTTRLGPHWALRYYNGAAAGFPIPHAFVRWVR